MKGAAAVPPRMTRSPRPSSTTMIGASHHFLLLKAKASTSDTALLGASAARDSNASDDETLRSMRSFSPKAGGSVLAEVVRDVGVILVRHPVGLGRSVELPPHRIVANQPHQQAGGGKQPEEHHRHQPV